MVNNIIKTTLVIIICLGISVNAALSVSDGSAFVTKAEFSADLNNLSNRMAQLENSLDSKIDSLVSTYLTKNGIWNAKKVNIDNSYTDLASSNFITSWTAFSNISKDIWSKSASVEKSGMCVATINVQGMKNGNSSYRCYLRYYGGAWPGFEDDLRMMLWLKEKINGVTYDRNVVQIGNSAMKTANGDPNGSSTACLTLPANQDVVLMSFVTKDSTIIVGMTQYVSDFQTGDSSLQNYGIVGDSRYRIQIKECNIF